jgi:hypothetical protein
VAISFTTCQALVDKAIIVESKQMDINGHKRKGTFQKHDSNSHRKLHYSFLPRHYDYTTKSHDHHHTGHRHDEHHSYNNDDHGHYNSEKLKKDLSQVTCFKCRNTGHYAYECPEKKDTNENGDGSGANPNHFKSQAVNNFTGNEAYEAAD